MRRIGVRALREQLRCVLDEVERGERVEITRNGKVVARIVPEVPIPPGAPPGLVQMLREGRARWSGKPVTLPEPQPLVGEGPTLSEIVLEQRGPREYGE